MRMATTVAALALIVVSSRDLVSRLQRSTAKVPAAEATFEAVKRLVPRGTVIASPVSWKLAWYCDRPSIRFQGRIGQLQQIDRHFVKVGAVYFDRKHAPAFRQTLSRSPLAESFPVVHLLPRGGILWLRREQGADTS